MSVSTFAKDGESKVSDVKYIVNFNIELSSFEDIAIGCIGQMVIYNSRGEQVNKIDYTSNAKSLSDCAEGFSRTAKQMEALLPFGHYLGGTVNHIQ